MSSNQVQLHYHVKQTIFLNILRFDSIKYIMHYVGKNLGKKP